MIARGLLLFGVGFGLAVLMVGPVAAADPNKVDAEQTGTGAKVPAKLVPLQGAWRLISVAAGDNEMVLDEQKPDLLIKGERVLYGKQEIARIAVGDAPDYQAVDFRFAYPDRVYEGICAADDKQLKICLNGENSAIKERPTALSAKDHTQWRLLTFERIEPAKISPGVGFVGVALRVEDNRVEIFRVIPGSPADTAGLKADDILLSVNGSQSRELGATVAAVRDIKPGDNVTLRIRRNKVDQDLKLRAEQLPFHFFAEVE